ncbi:MAG: hypothetical protein JW993_12350 [Sedimentisphaerales bacterium]|nr:hypothetical protein [Sedimentisphaerales bacterium]
MRYAVRVPAALKMTGATMITFFATSECSGCRTIREALEQMSLAREVVEVEGSGAAERLPPGMEPPVLVDDHDIVQGHRRILAHLERLADFKATWEKFQSDACYCDDTGHVE